MRSSQARPTTKYRSRQKRLDFTQASHDSLLQSSAIERVQERNSALPRTAGFFSSQRSARKSTARDATVSDEDDLVRSPQADAARERSTRRSPKDNIRQTRSSQSKRVDSPKVTFSNSNNVVDRFVDLGGDDSEDSESQELPTTPALRRNRRITRDKGAVVSLPVRVESDDEIQSSRSKRLKSGRKVSIVISDDDNESASDDAVEIETSEEDEPVKQSRRGLTNEEQQELEDDVLDLQSSGPEDIEPPSRDRTRTKRSAREEALDRLKRRRAGDRSVDITNSSQDEDETNHDLAGDEEDDEAPLAPRAARKDMFTHNEEDDDFLADDGEDTLGAPADDIPIEFTRYATMKAKELFKFAVEWMVQKKINPAFQNDDEIYDLAFKKLDDEIKGLAGSKFVSAAWTQDFSFALRARPEIQYMPIDRNAGALWMKDKCDACNRSGHPATWEIRFQGKPYHRHSLEEVVGPDDSDDTDSETEGAEDSERQTRDDKGHVILPESTTFYVGKYVLGFPVSHSKLSY